MISLKVTKFECLTKEPTLDVIKVILISGICLGPTPKKSDFTLYTSALLPISCETIWALHTHGFLYSFLGIQVQVHTHDFRMTVTHLQKVSV